MPDDRDKVGIRTANGFYVTAINGGGMGEDANALPIHTDATVVQDWERFRVFFNNDGTCNILTIGPYFLTAVNGGGIAAPANSPVATDRVEIGPWETFSLEEQEEGVYAFRTHNGDYLTAVNGGGMSTEGAPLQTIEAGDPSPFQYFILVPVKDEEAVKDVEAVRGEEEGAPQNKVC